MSEHRSVHKEWHGIGYDEYVPYCTCTLSEPKDDHICKLCGVINLEHVATKLKDRKIILVAYYQSHPFDFTGIMDALEIFHKFKPYAVDVQSICNGCEHIHEHNGKLCYYYPKCECEQGTSEIISLDYTQFDRLTKLTTLKIIKMMDNYGSSVKLDDITSKEEAK